MSERIQAFRDKIARGEHPFGFFVTMADPAVCEMAGYAGYDFVWIDAEHAPLDRREILGHIMAAQSSGACAFVRVPGADRYQMKAILDMGPDGVIFPFVSSAEVAEVAMAACLYPPRGNRGQGPIRAIRYGLEDEGEYIADHRNRTLRICQIEDVAGYEALDAIMDVDGVDCIFIGAADLSRSIADPSEAGQKRLDTLYEDICKRTLAKGLLLGAAGGTEKADVQPLMRRGVQWLVCGQDARMLSGTMKRNLAQLQSAEGDS